MSPAAPAVAAGWDCHVHLFDADQPLVPGHYRPAPRGLDEIEALAHRHGVGHLVLVQPSVHGTDNRGLLRALARQPGRHRGVVVVDPATPQTELAAMHALGVRGVRFNLVSPVGERSWPAAALEALAPRVRELGWHVQWYARPDDLGAIADWHDRARLPVVLDHLAGIHAGIAADDPAWWALQRLAAGGAWVKLSGWYRLRSTEPYRELQPLIGRVARLFAGRAVWGSDWPHTAFTESDPPAYATQWDPVVAALGEAAAEVTRHAGPNQLYA